MNGRFIIIRGIPTQNPAQVRLPEYDQGNPAGRLRGSRNKLSEAVICALLRDFSKHGEKAISSTWVFGIPMLMPRNGRIRTRPIHIFDSFIFCERYLCVPKTLSGLI